jgi:hypothetical protein
MATKKYTLIVVFAILLGLAAFVLFYRQTEGFQGATDPVLVKIFENLLESYNTAIAKMNAMGAQSKPVEGTTMEQFLKNQLAAIQKLGELCSTTVCTDQQIKDPSLLTAYKTANTVGQLGLPDITFETLASDSTEAPPMTDAAAATPSNAGGPDTQLPPAQMPAAVMNGTKPSLDECKKHYTCSVAATMISP